MPRNIAALLVAAAALAGTAFDARAQRHAPCSLSFESVAFGPLDYRLATPSERHLVEHAHFTRDVEQLVRGMSGTIGGDIAYTLLVFPNHPRALMAMSKLTRKMNGQMPEGARFPLECWFERALLYRPDDPSVHLVVGIETLKDGKREAAIQHLQKAEELGGENANIAYNLGLAYFDLNDFDKSLKYAKRAYHLGFPLPGLRDKLKRAGKWTD